MLAPCPNVDVVANKHATNPRTAEQPFIAGIGRLMAQARAAIATGANVAAALFGQGGNPPRNAFAIVYGGGPTNHFDNAFAPPHTNDEPTPHRWGLNRKEFQKTPTRKRTGRGSFVSLRVGGVTLATMHVREIDFFQLGVTEVVDAQEQFAEAQRMYFPNLGSALGALLARALPVFGQPEHGSSWASPRASGNRAALHSGH